MAHGEISGNDRSALDLEVTATDRAFDAPGRAQTQGGKDLLEQLWPNRNFTSEGMAIGGDKQNRQRAMPDEPRQLQ